MQILQIKFMKSLLLLKYIFFVFLTYIIFDYKNIQLIYIIQKLLYHIYIIQKIK